MLKSTSSSIYYKYKEVQRMRPKWVYEPDSGEFPAASTRWLHWIWPTSHVCVLERERESWLGVYLSLSWWERDSFVCFTGWSKWRGRFLLGYQWERERGPVGRAQLLFVKRRKWPFSSFLFFGGREMLFFLGPAVSDSVVREPTYARID